MSPVDLLNLGQESVSAVVSGLKSTHNADKTTINNRVAAVEADVDALTTEVVGQGMWQTYTPTAPTITGTTHTLTGSYARVGDTVDFQVELTLGSGGALSGSLNFTTPTAIYGISTNFPINGVAECFDTSASSRAYQNLRRIGTNVVQVISPAGVAGGPSSPFTWAVGDVVRIAGSYRAA